MARRIGLGFVVGFVVALVCWRGNQAAGLVSIFPDAVTPVALAALLGAALRLDRRRVQSTSESTPWRAALTIAATAGVVFGSAVVALGVLRFSVANPSLLAATFLGAFGAALACGAVAALLRSESRRSEA